MQVQSLKLVDIAKDSMRRQPWHRRDRRSVEAEYGQHTHQNPSEIGEHGAIWVVGEIYAHLEREQDLPIERRRIRADRVEPAFIPERRLTRSKDSRQVLQYLPAGRHEAVGEIETLGSGADNCHFTAQNIDELRKLIELRPCENSPHG